MAPCPTYTGREPSQVMICLNLGFQAWLEVVTWNCREDQMSKCVEESYKLSSTGEADGCLPVWHTSLS